MASCLLWLACFAAMELWVLSWYTTTCPKTIYRSEILEMRNIHQFREVYGSHRVDIMVKNDSEYNQMGISCYAI